MEKIGLVVTSISKPNHVLETLAKGCQQHGWNFVMIGDVSSPKNFKLDGCDYYGIDRQIGTGFKTAKKCLLKHYARKNIGYLIAIKKGAQVIVETDDDNLPLNGFWQKRVKHKKARHVQGKGWFNVYQHFTNKPIWPRGYPLSLVQKCNDKRRFPLKHMDCPIQQGLANKNPDVDAIYRLCMTLPINFLNKEAIALGQGVWSPFNSQNTTWWKETFPLLYLPSYCSFRMTDIWRSFVAQRILWENDSSVLFHKATVCQERNHHDLLKDFADEIPGYLHNERICGLLAQVRIRGGLNNIPEAMVQCYKKLIDQKIINPKELNLLEIWLKDLNSIRNIDSL